MMVADYQGMWPSGVPGGTLPTVASSKPRFGHIESSQRAREEQHARQISQLPVQGSANAPRCVWFAQELEGGWANPTAACTAALRNISAEVGPHNLYNVDDFCPSMNPDNHTDFTLDSWVRTPESTACLANCKRQRRKQHGSFRRCVFYRPDLLCGCGIWRIRRLQWRFETMGPIHVWTTCCMKPRPATRKEMTRSLLVCCCHDPQRQTNRT